MSTMAENVIAAGAENCPPMLERSQYNSWQSMLLYIRGKDHDIHLLDSVKNRTFNFGIVEVRATPNIPASTRDRTLDDLTPEEKIHEACDIRITNVILQDLRERVDSSLDAQALTNTTIFQIDDIDAFDSDFDEISTARAVFMANLSTYDSNVLSKKTKVKLFKILLLLNNKML
nr:hypothetical protein [Tanacetum cinerariifolium]